MLRSKILLLIVILGIAGAVAFIPWLNSDWISASSGASLTIKWTAPRDQWFIGDTVSNATRTVADYDIAWDTLPLDSISFARAVHPNLHTATNNLVPGAPGHAETYTLTGLPFARRIYVGLKSRDDATDSTGAPRYNWSALSNILVVTTAGKFIAPIRVIDLGK